MDKKRFRKLEHETLHNIETNLKKIYSSQEGNMSNIYRLNIRKSSWMKKILIAEVLILFFLAGVIFLFYIFGNNGKFEEESMAIEIYAPEDYSSGDEIAIEVEYKNKEKFALNDVEIILQYPQGFEFLASDPPPSNEFKDIWKLGNLKGFETGKMQIRGRIIGEVGSIIAFTSTASYQPQNISSRFEQKFNSGTAYITSSILTIDIEGPSIVIPDQDITYTLTYSNVSEKDLSNVLIQTNFPKSFVLLESRPNTTKKDVFASKKLYMEDEDDSGAIMKKNWLLEKIMKEEIGKIEISGKYTNSENEKYNLLVQIGEVRESDYKIYQEEKMNFEVVNHGLSLSLTVNGSKIENSVNFSDTLNYSIIYKNIGGKTIYNLDIIAVINSEMVNWDSLIDKNGGERIGEKLLWRASSTPALAILRPMDEGTLDFSLQIKNMAKVNLQKDNLKTNTYAEAIIKTIDDFQTNISVKTEPVISKINTELEMKVEGRYFDDDNIPVGQGPLPPVVGKKTTLRIYWSLANNLNEVSGVEVKTKLSPDAKWEDKFFHTVGALTYNTSDNSITWKIPKISPNKSFEDLNAWFDVSITPKQEQVGKLILLITESTLTAKDTITNKAISHVGRGVTSNLEDDAFGGGKGLVEQAE